MRRKLFEPLETRVSHAVHVWESGSAHLACPIKSVKNPRALPTNMRHESLVVASNPMRQEDNVLFTTIQLLNTLSPFQDLSTWQRSQATLLAA